MFRGSPTVQLAVSGGSSPPAGPAPAPAPGPGASPATSAAAGSPGGGGGGAARCCDTGRPLFTDPLTGQSVCSCQYELLGYQRLAAPGLPLSMYSAPYSDGMAAYFPALGADQAPFYTSAAAGLELKENLAAGAATWPYPSVYHPYDAAFAGYPFNGYGMDLNGARRKNATRETTSTLKAWLNEHKKNPYPTKGEKIMLAIITKMTLTQVSTWFANARRRLKKENKMTWEPRNRVEDEDNNNDDDSGRKSADHAKDPDSKDSGTGSSEDGERLERPLGADTASEWSESRADSGPDSPECLFERPQHLLHPAYHLHPGARLLGAPPPSSSPPPPGAGPSKPRIWSLADMANKEEATPVSTTSSPFYSGKLVSPLHHHHPHLHHAGQYVRPAAHHDFYRSFYGPTAAAAVAAASHLAGAGASTGAGTGPDVSLLETYSRTFGSKITASGSSGTPFPTPLGITVAPSGASSSSSSGSSEQQLKSPADTAKP